MPKADAYDKTSGEKLPYKVPSQWFGLFPNLRKTPTQKAAEATPKKKEG